MRFLNPSAPTILNTNHNFNEMNLFDSDTCQFCNFHEFNESLRNYQC